MYDNFKIRFQHGKGQNHGRQYAKASMAIPYMKREIRNALWHDVAKDFDLENSLPIILYELIKQNIGFCPSFLEKYVNDRAGLLQRNPGFSKLAFNTLMNTDKLTERHPLLKLIEMCKQDKEFFSSLVTDFPNLKDDILEKFKKKELKFEGIDFSKIVLKETNGSNPKSSKIIQILCIIENAIITKAHCEAGKPKLLALIYDGFILLNENDNSDWDYVNEIINLNFGCTKILIRLKSMDSSLIDPIKDAKWNKLCETFLKQQQQQRKEQLKLNGIDFNDDYNFDKASNYLQKTLFASLSSAEHWVDQNIPRVFVLVSTTPINKN
eukprot:Pgem_evm2s19338